MHNCRDNEHFFSDEMNGRVTDDLTANPWLSLVVMVVVVVVMVVAVAVVVAAVVVVVVVDVVVELISAFEIHGRTRLLNRVP